MCWPLLRSDASVHLPRTSNRPAEPIRRRPIRLHRFRECFQNGCRESIRQIVHRETRRLWLHKCDRLKRQRSPGWQGLPRGVVREGAGVTVCENNDGMLAIDNRGVHTTVRRHNRQANTDQFREIAPNARRSIFRGFAALGERCWIPESHKQFSHRAIGDIGIFTRRVNQLHHARPNTAWSRRDRCNNER